MNIETGHSYRCEVPLRGIPTVAGEIVKVKALKADYYGLEIELEGKKNTVPLDMFREPFFTNIQGVSRER